MPEKFEDVIPPQESKEVKGSKMEYHFIRMPDGRVVMHKIDALPLHKIDALPLDNEHHRRVVEDFYSSNDAVDLPKKIRQYGYWRNVVNQPELTEETLVFVVGGITKGSINLGRAILISDGGIIEHPIKCGRFHTGGGITEIPVTELLRK